MFKKIDNCLKQKEAYVVMGQVCIDKAFRKQGIYNFMKEQLQTKFEMIITEVDIANTRSHNAYYAVGFKLMYTYNSKQQDWALISWDWS